MPTESIVVRTTEDREERIEWDESSPLNLTIETRVGDLTIRRGVFRGGVSEGVEIIRMANSKMHVDILPTRGMSLWRMQAEGVRYQWQSPVVGPVHPNYVDVSEPSGLGWLSGFDELVVRCGLESNGAPEHDASGRLVYPLHGHIANTPADAISVEFDEASGRAELVAETIEARLFFKRLRMRTRVRIHADRNDVELLDDVTNELSTPATMQMLYHVNIGAPVLGKDARLNIAVEEVAPRDDHAAEEIDDWERFDGPTSGYRERVYFAKPISDESGMAHAMLADAKRARGLSVRFKTSTLPWFVLWKNCAEIEDGYVGGLEPATNFPNPRSFEHSQGRTVELGPGETESFRVTLSPLTTAAAVQQAGDAIRKMQEDQSIEVVVSPTPRPHWSVGVPGDGQANGDN
ncbi:aldose 1-epimerase family protein [Aporhodopirellula aestuarii]|uniref:Aldose 1-epimerase family protein n=1 Tax=Aporhodopirellula aestuarii TaxID=2950107 RepID=A0ABT0U6D2_9BACT|nr:aldose 1-epimerase family protein [Aporhodopirellula aestuarii]MCM2372362.1 aldose 1-epimerase family protein [Aporhodopirellula aestuarii]